MTDTKAYVLTVHSVTNINSSCKWYVKVRLAGKDKQKSKAFKPVKNSITFNETFYFPSWGDNVVVQLSVWKERRFTHVEVARTELLCPCAPEYPECKYEQKTELFPTEKKKSGESGARSRANTGLGGVDTNKPCGEITFTVLHPAGNKKYTAKLEEEKKVAAAKKAEGSSSPPASPSSASSPSSPTTSSSPTSSSSKVEAGGGDGDVVLNRRRKLVQDSWDIVQSAKIREQATRLLLGRWWEIDASARSIFQQFPKGKGDGLMKNLGVAVKLLNRPSELRKLLIELGSKHAGYGVKAEQFSTLGVALVWTLQMGLGNKWTAELEEAWLWAFSSFASQMTEGLEKEYVTSTITHYKREIVSSWGLVKNAEDRIATLFYERFFEIDKTAAVLYGRVNMTTQKPLFMKMVRSLVDSLDNIQGGGFESTLKDLAKRHQGYGVTPAHLETFSAAFLHTLKTGLGPACTAAVREAWGWLLGVIAGVMTPQLDPSSKEISLSMLMSQGVKKEGEVASLSSDGVTALLARHQSRIATSWNLVKNSENMISTLFYGRFFEVDPSAQELFKNVQMSTQKTHLMAMIRSLATNITNLSEVLPSLRALATRHRGYGVKRSHCDTFGASFLWALQTGLGDGCTAEVLDAWKWLFSVVAGIFRDHLETDPAPKTVTPIFSGPLVTKEERVTATLGAAFVKHRRDILKSWELAKHAEEAVGLLLYGRCIELNSNNKEIFKNIPQTKELTEKLPHQLQQYLLFKLFRLLASCANKEDDGDVYRSVYEVAEEYKNYSLTPNLFDIISMSFLWTLDIGLGDQCTESVRAGWTWWLSVVGAVFREVYDSKPSTTPANTGSTSRGKQLIQSSWALIEPIGEKAGVLFFGYLFEADPSIRALFANHMGSHIKLFVKALSIAVANIENPSVLSPHALTLARQHAHLGLTSQHFNTFGAALFQTFKIGLGEKWNESVREAWLHFFSELAVTITEAIRIEQVNKENLVSKLARMPSSTTDNSVTKRTPGSPRSPQRNSESQRISESRRQSSKSFTNEQWSRANEGKSPPPPPPFSADAEHSKRVSDSSLKGLKRVSEDLSRGGNKQVNEDFSTKRAPPPPEQEDVPVKRAPPPPEQDASAKRAPPPPEQDTSIKRAPPPPEQDVSTERTPPPPPSEPDLSTTKQQDSQTDSSKRGQIVEQSASDLSTKKPIEEPSLLNVSAEEKTEKPLESETQSTEKPSNLEAPSEQPLLQSNESSSNSSLISTSVSLEPVKQPPPPPAEKRQSVDEQQLSEPAESSQNTSQSTDGSSKGGESYTEEHSDGNHK